MREESYRTLGGSQSPLLCLGPLRAGLRTRWPGKGVGQGAVHAEPHQGSQVQHSASLSYRPEEIMCRFGSPNMERDKPIDSC